VTDLAPFPYGVYRLKRRLSEMFQAECTECSWVGEWRMTLPEVIADLDAHINNPRPLSPKHQPLPVTAFSHV
jgi:hypothetical protein